MNESTVKSSIDNLDQDLVSEFDKLVVEFNGSTKQTDMILDIGVLIENMGHDKDYADNGLTMAIKNLRRGFNDAYQIGGWEDLKSLLEDKGVIVKPARLPMLPPGKGEIKVGSGRGIQQAEKQPRLVWAIDALLKDGVTTDQFFIEPGIPVPGAFRKEPYFLINLPGFGEEGRQIGVCNLYGAVTFVSDRIYAPEFFTQYSIDEVKELPGFDSFILRDRNKWEAQLVNFVMHGLEARDIQTVDIIEVSTKPRSKRIHLTSNMIFEKMLEVATKDEKSAFPSLKSKEGVEVWKEWSWKMVNYHVQNNLSYSGLVGLRDEHISAQARFWLEKNPHHPKDKVPPEDATLPDYPYISFGTVDQALQNIKGSGKTSLWRVLVTSEAPVIEGTYLEACDITAEMIFTKMLEGVTQNDPPMFRVSAKESVSGWNDWDWSSINSHARNNLGYTSIPVLRDKFISDQTRKWLGDNPEHPLDQAPPSHPTLPDYPHISFGNVDQALQNITGKGRTSLWRILVTSEPPVIEGAYLKACDITAEMIFTKMLEEIVQGSQRAFPSSSSKKNVLGWRGWSWQALQNLSMNSYSGLSSLRDAKICEQARVWLGSHPDHPRDEVPPFDAVLPDYPDVTFGVIDEALQEMIGGGKTSLWRVLVSGDNPVIEGNYIQAENITADMIFKKMLEEVLPTRQGMFPTYQSKKDVLGWRGWSWQALQGHVQCNHSSYSGLSSLRDAKIREQARVWFGSHPDHPRDEVPPFDAVLPDYPDVTFGVIDEALQKVMSKGQRSLWRILVSGDNPLIEGDYIQAENITADTIFKKMLEEVQPNRKGQFPSAESKVDVLGWRGWCWRALNNISRNLSYDGLASLRDTKICEQAGIWLEQHPDHPKDEVPDLDATLPDYAHVTFGLVDTALKNGAAQAKTSLWRVLVSAADPVIEGDYLQAENITVDMIFKKMLEEAQPNRQGQFPSTGSQKDVLNWRDWNWLDLGTLARNLSYGSLSSLRDAKICEQARVWFESHLGHPRDEVPPVDAVLPNYPDVTFGIIDEALQKMMTTGKTSLREILSRGEVIMPDERSILKPSELKL